MYTQHKATPQFIMQQVAQARGESHSKHVPLDQLDERQCSNNHVKACIFVASFCLASTTPPSLRKWSSSPQVQRPLAQHGTHVRLVLAGLVEGLDGLLPGVPLGLLSVVCVEAWHEQLLYAGLSRPGHER